jgi:hypothetical protein
LFTASSGSQLGGWKHDLSRAGLFGGTGGKASLPGLGVSSVLLFFPLAAGGGKRKKESLMSHLEFLKQKFKKSEGAGSAASLLGCGVRRDQTNYPCKKGEVGYSPTFQPKGWPPFAIPLIKPLDKYRTSVR